MASALTGKLIGQNSNQCTEVRFSSFFSGGFITAIVVNPSERKLEKRTSVQWIELKFWLLVGCDKRLQFKYLIFKHSLQNSTWQ